MLLIILSFILKRKIRITFATNMKSISKLLETFLLSVTDAVGTAVSAEIVSFSLELVEPTGSSCPPNVQLS